MQTKITKEDELLDELGNLKNPGYSLNLVQKYDRSKIKAKKSRIKEWDYYLIYNDKYAVALTIDDNSYMNLMSASFIDFESATEITKSPIKFFTNGRTNLPSSSKIGDVRYATSKVDFNFMNDGKTRHLVVSFKKFYKEKDLYVDLTLTDEPKDSMVIATPFDKPQHFYYNQKIVGFKVSGFVSIGSEQIKFSPDNTFGLLDWGRGVWTYRNTWYWGAGMGRIGKDLIGWNIGYGFGNTSYATENMLFYNGIAHKLEDVKFNIPSKDGCDDYLSKWTFTSSDKRFEMYFQPIIDRKSKTDIGIICSDQHQVFGKFNGKIVLDNKKTIVIKDFIGFAEKVYNKW